MGDDSPSANCKITIPQIQNAMKEIYLCRHGRTSWNDEHRIQGRTDIPLDEVGLAQARDLSRFLATCHPKARVVVSSPLQRARQTAEPIARGLGIDIVIDEDITEIDTGEYTGQNMIELKKDPTWQAHIADPFVTGYGPYGEPSDVVRERVMRAIDRYDHAIFVTHASPIRHVILALLDIPTKHMYHLAIHNASATCMELHDDFAKLVFMNHTACYGSVAPE